MLKDREVLCALIPHAGDMCLIERVAEWDDKRIRCLSNTHLDPRHPLRRSGRLHAVHGIEYAAQAAALHGALLTGHRPNTPAAAPGRLVAVRDVVFSAVRLDELEQTLVIEAARLIASGEGVIYRFSVGAGGRELLHGRLSVLGGNPPA